MEGNDYGFTDEDFDILENDAFDPKVTKKTTEDSDDTTLAETDIDILSDNPEEGDRTKEAETTVAEGSETGEVTDSGTEDGPTDGDDDTYQIIAENLLQMGVFTLNEGEEKLDLKEPQAFADRWKAEQHKGAVTLIDQIVGQYGEEYADAFDKIFNKGLNPYEYFTRQSALDSYEGLDLEDNDEARKSIIRTYLRTINPDFTPEKIEAKLQKMVDLDLIGESDDAKEYMVKREKAEIERRAQEEQQRHYQDYQRQEKFGESVFQILSSKIKDGDFDGIPVTPKVAESAFDFLYTKKKYQDGQVMTEAERFLLDLQHPGNHDAAVKFALMARSGFDTSKIRKKATSKDTNELFKDLKRKTTAEKRNNPAPTSPDNNIQAWFG